MTSILSSLFSCFEAVQQGYELTRDLYFGKRARSKSLNERDLDKNEKKIRTVPIEAVHVIFSTQIKVGAPLPEKIFLKDPTDPLSEYNDPFWKSVHCAISYFPTGNPVIIEGEPNNVYDSALIARHIVAKGNSPMTGKKVTLADLRSYKQQEVDDRIAEYFKNNPQEKEFILTLPEARIRASVFVGRDERLPKNLYLNDPKNETSGYNSPFWKEIECKISKRPAGNPVIIVDEPEHVYDFDNLFDFLRKGSRSPATGKYVCPSSIVSYRQKDVDVRLKHYLAVHQYYTFEKTIPPRKSPLAIMYAIALARAILP